jgi:hypothetical protein
VKPAPISFGHFVCAARETLSLEQILVQATCKRRHCRAQVDLLVRIGARGAFTFYRYHGGFEAIAHGFELRAHVAFHAVMRERAAFRPTRAALPALVLSPHYESLGTMRRPFFFAPVTSVIVPSQPW